VEWEGTLGEAIEKVVTERNMLENKIVAGVARARYLGNLADDRAAANAGKDAEVGEEDDEKICIICRNEVCLPWPDTRA
jgi:hypothetical protein